MFIKRENDVRAGCWNACLIMVVFGCVIALGAWLISQAQTEPEEETIAVEVAHPITGETIHECLVLFRAEDGSPDYRLGREEECEKE